MNRTYTTFFRLPNLHGFITIFIIGPQKLLDKKYIFDISFEKIKIEKMNYCMLDRTTKKLAKSQIFMSLGPQMADINVNNHEIVKPGSYGNPP